jgi:hypothetical protein
MSLSPCLYWSQRAELNRRPTDYESVALPLSYAGFLGWMEGPTFNRFYCKKSTGYIRRKACRLSIER